MIRTPFKGARLIWARTTMDHRTAFALTSLSDSLTLALIGVLLILVVPTSALTRVSAAKDDTVDPAPADSGIEGQVFISPTHGGPVCVGESASRPYQASLTVLDGQGTVTQSFQTNADGTFHVPLPPGDYMLHPELSGPLPRASDQAVTVVAGQHTQIQITYDSGLR